MLELRLTKIWWDGSKKKTRLELREGVKTRARTKMCKVPVAEEEVRLRVPWGLCVVN
jgi:hypothetical protein